MKHKRVNITCYCGAFYPNCVVGANVKCVCGITLHTQQKARGTGRVWGTVGGKKTDKRYKDLVAMVATGKSKLEAWWFE